MAIAVATIAVIELPHARRNAASDADEERMWERHASNSGRALSRPARLVGGLAYWRWPRGELALRGTRLSMKLADGRRVFDVDVTDDIGLSLRMWRRGHLHLDVAGVTYKVTAGHANNMQLARSGDGSTSGGSSSEYGRVSTTPPDEQSARLVRLAPRRTS